MCSGPPNGRHYPQAGVHHHPIHWQGSDTKNPRSYVSVIANNYEASLLCTSLPRYRTTRWGDLQEYELDAGGNHSATAAPHSPEVRLAPLARGADVLVASSTHGRAFGALAVEGCVDKNDSRSAVSQPCPQPFHALVAFPFVMTSLAPSQRVWAVAYLNG